jgi:hypothetical protein
MGVIWSLLGKNGLEKARDGREHRTVRDNFAIIRGKVNLFSDHGTDKLPEVKSDSQGTQRLDIPRGFLDETIRLLAQIVQVGLIELVFHLGEVGICEWDESQSENVTIVTSMAEQTIHHKMNMKLNHASAILYISAARESLTPYMIACEDRTAFGKHLRKRDVDFQTDFILKAQAKPDDKVKILSQYTDMVYLSKLWQPAKSPSIC